VIASNHGLLGAAPHHVVVGSRHQRADKRVSARSGGEQCLAALDFGLAVMSYLRDIVRLR